MNPYTNLRINVESSKVISKKLYRNRATKLQPDSYSRNLTSDSVKNVILIFILIYFGSNHYNYISLLENPSCFMEG